MPVLVITPGNIVEALFVCGILLLFLVLWIRRRLDLRRARRRAKRDANP